MSVFYCKSEKMKAKVYSTFHFSRLTKRYVT